MIVSERFYNVECDCCGALANEELWRVDENGAKDDAFEAEFLTLGEKCYCPNCYQYDSDDNIVTKDGKSSMVIHMKKLRRKRMKAPDKIYVREFPQGLNQLWSSVLATQTSAIEQHVYIRKDALLEWAKKEMKKWSSESNTAQGVKMGLTLVLDKIESL